jgi:hypothetical protein
MVLVYLLYKKSQEGTNVFSGDNNVMRYIDKNEFANVQPEIAQLYKDFCVWKDGKIKGPSNFNNLTVGWYLNHSMTPNVRYDENSGDFIAISRHSPNSGVFAAKDRVSDRLGQG